MSATSSHDYLSLLRSRLDEAHWAALSFVREQAEKMRLPLFLVGGAVRDLLLNRGAIDLDLMVEGDALAVAEAVAHAMDARAVFHRRFGTAKVRAGRIVLDLATARAESYARPGALPTVRPGTLFDDLFRRDFTVNAMALRLSAPGAGELVDPFGGEADLDARLIRILHERSFIDDATRIWRAVRYEQRLGFRLEETTEALARRDVAMLKTISGARLRRELELALLEAEPERALERLHSLGALAQMTPPLPGDDTLARWVQATRRRYPSREPRDTIYLALLACHLSPSQAEEMIGFLRFPRKQASVIRGAARLMAEAPGLEKDMGHGKMARVLEGFPPEPVAAVSIALEGRPIAERLLRYLEEYRYIRPYLHSREIMEMGVPQGPALGEALAVLRAARIEGRTHSKEDEVKLLRDWAEWKGGG